MKSGELNADVIKDTEEKITNLAMEKHSALKMIPKGSLLIAMYGATVGQVAYLDIEATSNQAVCHIVPNLDLVNPRFLYHALSFQKRKWLSMRVGGGQPNISMKIIKQTEIYLPPFAEQDRIASILDKAQAIASNSFVVVAKRETFRDSVLTQMFSRKLVSTRPLPGYVELSSIARKTKSLDPKMHPNCEFDLYSIPAYDAGECEKCLGKDIGSSKKILETDDVVISRLIPHIRRVWVIPEGDGNEKLGSSEWIVFNSSKFHPVFLRAMLLSEEFHRHFLNSVAGVGGSLVRARPSVVLKLNLFCPPMSKQIAFAEIVEKFQKLPSISADTLYKFKSIEQEMFA